MTKLYVPISHCLQASTAIAQRRASVQPSAAPTLIR